MKDRNEFSKSFEERGFHHKLVRLEAFKKNNATSLKC